MKPQVHPQVLDCDWDLAKTTIDYAMVTPIRNPSTGETIFSVGGLGLNGTYAAAPFVTDENELK